MALWLNGLMLLVWGPQMLPCVVVPVKHIYTVYIIMLIRFEDVLTSKSRVWLEFVDMCIYVSYSRRALQKEKV